MFETKSKEKQSVTMPENYISQGCLGFNHDAGTIVPGLGGFYSHHGRQAVVRPGSFCSDFGLDINILY